MKQFGLIGYPLKHSFSKKYFQEKFIREAIYDSIFELFPLTSLSEFKKLIQISPELVGLSVTIPYKEKIIPFLNELDEVSSKIGAVNCIKISHTNQNLHFLKGYNTDTTGFEKSLLPLLKPYHLKALIIGSGGASKAISYILNKLNISFLIVTRTPIEPNHISYNQITEAIIKSHLLIINTSPLGMYPNINTFPEIEYMFLSEKHLLFDLVYNPEETMFLTKGKSNGAQIQNGLPMLYFQAEKSWDIWNTIET